MSLAKVKKELKARGAEQRKLSEIAAKRDTIHLAIRAIDDRLYDAMRSLVCSELLQKGTWKLIDDGQGYEQPVKKLAPFLDSVWRSLGKAEALRHSPELPKDMQAYADFCAYKNHGKDNGWVYRLHITAYVRDFDFVSVPKFLGMTIDDDRAKKVKERLRILRGDRRRLSDNIEQEEARLKALTAKTKKKSKTKSKKKK